MDHQSVQFHYTPVDLCKALIATVKIDPTDRLLEPFAGAGAFYDNFPAENAKDWCEIDRGRDFFEYNEKCDVIITNPPFFTMDGKRTPMVFKCLTKCIELAEKKVCFLMSTRCLNAFTPLRLAKFAETGWGITSLVVCNVKEWFGRYYFVTFEKTDAPCLTFITKSYSVKNESSVAQEI